MHKKDYELIEQKLHANIKTMMTTPREARAGYIKIMLQDIIADLAEVFEQADPKFKRTNFYYYSGAMEYLQND